MPSCRPPAVGAAVAMMPRRNPSNRPRAMPETKTGAPIRSSAGTSPRVSQVPGAVARTEYSPTPVGRPGPIRARHPLIVARLLPREPRSRSQRLDVTPLALDLRQDDLKRGSPGCRTPNSDDDSWLSSPSAVRPLARAAAMSPPARAIRRPGDDVGRQGHRRRVGGPGGSLAVQVGGQVGAQEFLAPPAHRYHQTAAYTPPGHGEAGRLSGPGSSAAPARKGPATTRERRIKAIPRSSRRRWTVWGRVGASCRMNQQSDQPGDEWNE